MGVIYKITNTENGKLYVGKTASDMNDRYNTHIYEAKTSRTNSVLHKAIRKYGTDSFTIELIEECANNIISEREIYWIRMLNSQIPFGYNMTSGGEGVPGYKHTDETKVRLSQLNSGRKRSPEVVEIIRRTHLGKVVSEETRNKLSEGRKGRFTKEDNGFYGKHHTQETKEKLSAMRLGKTSSVAQPVLVMDTEGNEIASFVSIKKCYEWLFENGYTKNKNYQSVTTQIKDAIKGKQSQAYGFTYKLIEKV